MAKTRASAKAARKSTKARLSNKRAKHVSVDLNKTREKKEELDSRGSARFWRPQVGKSLIRILPPWTADGPNAAQFAREVFVHWGVPPGAEKTRPIICPKHNANKRCYICDQVDALFSSGDPADIQLAKDMRAQQRYYSNIIDMRDPVLDNGDPKIQVFEYGPKMLDEFLAYFNDNDYGDITDPEEGFNIKIERRGVGKEDTKYTVKIARDPSSFTKEQIDEDFVFDNLNDLDHLEKLSPNMKILSNSKLRALYEGEYDEDDSDYEEEEEEEKPKRRKQLTSDKKKKPASKKSKKYEDDDDDDEDFDDDEDLDDEDEEEDDDEDDDDEDYDLDDDDDDEDLDEEEEEEEEDDADEIEEELKSRLKSRKKKAPAVKSKKATVKRRRR